MEWIIALAAVAILGFAAVAASGRLGQLGPLHLDRRPLKLPEAELTAEDLAAVRFLVVPRGYSMQQVDQLLDRLQSQLRDVAGCSIAQESGIIEVDQTSDRRNDDGSDETSDG